jgi:hypothetical protein
MAITKATSNSIAPAAKGDLVVGTATNDSNILAVGTNNYILTADSAEATGLKWAAPAGGGKVLQVVSANTTTSTSIITATYTDTTITATITPTSASSKILVLASSVAYIYRTTGNEYGAGARLMRGATVLFTNANSQTIGGENVGGKSLANMNSWVYLDSPATTSATTYKIQAKTDGTAEVRFQVGADTSVITLLEIGA